MLFDTHAHYDDPRFEKDRDAVIQSLSSHGVGLVANIGANIKTSYQSVELANRYDFIYATVGIHPGDVFGVTEEDIDILRSLALENSKVRAIGEIGLDYYYEDIPRQIQQKAFRDQMALAQELDMPVIVHERDAHNDGLAIVKEFPRVKGVFHCYSGSAEMARQLVNLGWYIGFTGVLTFKNARKAVETAASIPLDRIVLETDCPFMAPEPFRGKRNHPGYLYRMAEKLAEIRGISVEEVHAATFENGKRLYRIP